MLKILQIRLFRLETEASDDKILVNYNKQSKLYIQANI